MLTAVMRRLALTIPGIWTFSDVVEILNDKDEILRSCRDFSPATLHSLRDGKSNQAAGIFGELRTSTVQLEHLARAWDGGKVRISLSRWVNDEIYRQGYRVIIVQGNRQYKRLEGFLTSMIFARVIKDILALPDSTKRRMWAFIDEFGNLPAIEDMDTMLTAVRSKGLRVVAAIQEIAQIEAAYSPAFAKIFSGCFGTVLAGQVSGDTARFLSDYFGKNQVEREVVGESKSRSAKDSRRTESKGQQIVVESALLDTAFSTIKPPNLKVPATFWLKTSGWPAAKLLYPVIPMPERFASNVKPDWLRGMSPLPKRHPQSSEAPMSEIRSFDDDHGGRKR